MIKKGIYLLCFLLLTMGVVTAKTITLKESLTINFEDFKVYAEKLYQTLDDSDLDYNAFETA